MTTINTKAYIEDMVSNNDLVIFIKGLPTDNSCGYSSRAIKVLEHYGIDYVYENVLKSEDIRKGVKSYSGVKTLPQIFIKGQYFGGSDDLQTLHADNRLEMYLSGKGITSSKDQTLPNLVLTPVTKAEMKSCGKGTAPSTL